MSQTRPVGQDTAKSTEWVHGEDWSDCTDTQVDEHIHHFLHITFIGFMYFKVIIIMMSSSSWSSNSRHSQRQQQ